MDSLSFCYSSLQPLYLFCPYLFYFVLFYFMTLFHIIFIHFFGSWSFCFLFLSLRTPTLLMLLSDTADSPGVGFHSVHQNYFLTCSAYSSVLKMEAEYSFEM
jgi:hypothetical protein